MTASKPLLILEPTKYPRTDPDIVFGKTKPTISKKGFRKYPDDYNPILEYWEQIQTGETLVPKKVYQQYEEIVRWIKDNGYKEWFYSNERANHIIEFAENFCCHSKGKLAGKKVVLELWEKAYLASVYGFIDIEGNRKHQRVVLIVGKKNGKSLLGSIMGLYGLAADGEGGPEVYAVAPLALDTPILTTRGWTTMGRLRVDDKVFGEDGRPATVTYLSPVVIRKTYRVKFDDGSEITATDNHLWTVEKRYTPQKGASQTYKVVTVTTEELAQSVNYGNRPRFRIPVAAPLQLETRHLPIDPYVLGVWLGDGRSNRGAIVVDKSDFEIVEEIKARGYEFSPHYSNKANLVYGTIIGLRTALRKLNLLDNKHIPDTYKMAGAEQRMDLLRGLMDTDGTITKTGECRFVSANEQLAKDVLEIALGLGYKAHMRLTPTNGNGPAWIVSFKAYDDCWVFHLSRKAKRQIQRRQTSTKARYRWIVAVEEVEPVPARCIAVDSPSHLFLAGRNLIATHNTKRDQAKIVWQEAKRMVQKSPALRKRIKTLSYDIVAEFNDGIFKALASDADSLDGLNVHVVIMDEWHQWKNGRALYDIMADGITAREQPLIIMTSTAGTIREDIFDEIYEEAEIQFNNMKLGNEVDDRTLFFIYELDKKDEWRDANNWVKANPGLGTIKKLRALQDKAKRVADNPKLEKNFVCKEFNIRETSSESWLIFEQLNNTATFDIEKLKPRYCIAGIDLGATTDLTCATIIFRVPDDPVLYVKQMYWLPGDLLDKRVKEDKIPYDKWLDQGLLRVSEGNKVNYKDVTKWLLEVQNDMDIYIFKIGYDNWSSTYFVDELEQNFGKITEPVIQGAKTFSSPMKRFAADLEAKKINYNNNPILKWNLSNAAISIDRNDNIALIKTSNQRRRIDGVASLLDAYIVYERNFDDYMNLI